MANLAEITEYKNEKLQLSFNEKLTIRQGAMRLAFIMYQILGDKEEEIKYWEDSSNNDNEFSDIRNRWQ